MDGKNRFKSSFPNKKLGHLMDFKHNECAPFVGYGQSNYGVLLKVWIKTFNCIPSTIELVAKNLKHMINNKCANYV